MRTSTKNSGSKDGLSKYLGYKESKTLWLIWYKREAENSTMTPRSQTLGKQMDEHKWTELRYSFTGFEVQVKYVQQVTGYMSLSL